MSIRKSIRAYSFYAIRSKNKIITHKICIDKDNFTFFDLKRLERHDIWKILSYYIDRGEH